MSKEPEKPNDVTLIVNLNDLAEYVRDINRKNGWNVFTTEDLEDKYKFLAVCMLIVTEVSEAVEAFREHDNAHIGEEIADVIIRALDLAGGICDINHEIYKKLEKNKTRGYRHGGKKV